MPAVRLAALGIAVSLALTGPAPRQDVAAAVDAAVRAEMDRQHVPGVAVAVVQRGAVIVAKGYGLANVEHETPITPETIFQSGSLGKMFTATAVMLLVQDGKVALGDSIARLLPGAPAAWAPITVRHLLTHTSGVPEYTDGAVDLRRDYTEDELAQMAFGLKLDFPPGEKWKYSNTGYVLLGLVIHKVSGTFYGDLLAERVFKPLGMNTTRVISEADIVPHRAAGYRLVKGELKNQEWVSPSLNTTADGALYFSVRDLIAWDAGVRAGKILNAESWRTVLTPVTLNDGKRAPYGFGWAIGVRGGQPVYQHGGSWQGFKTHYARFERGDLSVIVLANLAQAEPAKIVDAVAGTIDPALAK